MPRYMSFMHTTKQFRNRTKTVTRRLGWWNLKPGDIVMGAEKCQGLKKGEHIRPLGAIRIVSIRSEPLYFITPEDCAREGFPGMQPVDFVKLFMGIHRDIDPETTVNRIEFEYIDPAQPDRPTATEEGQLYSAGCALL
jgi:hypothetical protein